MAGTSLVAGDVAIVELNSNDETEGFEFVLLTPISAGTTIGFTGASLNSNGTTGYAGDPQFNPVTLTWTSTAAMTAGSVVSISAGSDFLINTPSTGTVSGEISQNQQGYRITAFQGTLGSGATYLHTAAFNGVDQAGNVTPPDHPYNTTDTSHPFWNIASTTQTSVASQLPTSLSSEVAFSYTNSTDTTEANDTPAQGGYYSGPTSGTKAQLIADINNSADWTLEPLYTSSPGVVKAFTVTTPAPPAPTITSATYDAGTGTLVVAGSNLTTSTGSFNLTALTIGRQAGITYALTGGTIDSATSTALTVTLTAADQLAVDGLLNKNGTTSAGGATYNIAATAAFDTGGSASNGGITVSSALTPTISAVAYNATTGVLTVTGTGFENEGGDGGGVLSEQYTLTGKGGGGSAVPLPGGGASATSRTSATLTLTSAQKASVNAILDANGTSDGTATYSLAVGSGWDAGVGAAVSVGVTVTGDPPTVTAGNITLSGATGTGGVYKIGDTVTAVWNDTTSGDNNSAALTGGVTVDFQQFGGPTSAVATNTNGIWTATYKISAGSASAGNRNVSVTATDAAGPTTTAGTNNVAVDDIAPTALSIVAIGASPNNAGSDAFTVTFSEPVTGVTAGAFTAVRSNSAQDQGIVVTEVSSSVYTVTVFGVTGDGTLALNLKSASNGITDTAGNAMFGGFAGPTVTIDHTPPTITGVTLDQASYKLGDTVTATIALSANDGNGAYTLGAGSTIDGQTLTTGAYDSAANTLKASFVATAGVTQVISGAVSDNVVVDDGLGNASAASTAGIAGTTIDTIAPVFTSATINGNTLVLTYAETGSGLKSVNSVPDFTVNVGTTAMSFSAGPIDRTTETLVLGNPVAFGDNVTIAYSNTNLVGAAVQDAAGNQAASFAATPVTNTTPQPAPTVVSAGSSPVGGSDLDAGQAIAFTVTFSTPVAVTGTPTLTLTGERTATYASGSGTSTLTFGYTVQAGDTVSDLEATGINLPGAASITDGGVNAVLTGFTTLDTGIQLDTTAPSVTAVTVPAGATYGAGQTLDFTTTFSEPVTVSGTPRLAITLASGTVDANYVSTSGNTLTFAYQVQPGDNAATGIATGTSIDINGGSIKDAAGNNAVLTLTGEPSTAGIDVDGVPPTVSNINRVNPNPSNNHSESFEVSFSEPVTPADPSDFTLVGTGVSGTISDVFRINGRTDAFMVNVTNVTGDGTLRLNLNNIGPAIKDFSGNTLTAAFTSGQSYTIDQTVPTLGGITTSTTNGSDLDAGQTITFSLVTSEPVVVTGKPTLTLDGGRSAVYTQGTGTTDDPLVFTYTVAAGDNDADLKVTSLAGGTIADLAGNAFTGSVTLDTHLQLDTTAPAPPGLALATDTGIAGDGITSDPTLTFTPSAQGDTLLYKVDAATSFTATVPSFATDGRHTVSVEEQDTAGNISAVSSLTFTLDGTPPKAPDIVAPGTGTSTTDKRPVISGTGEAGATLTLSANKAVLGSVPVDENGVWTYTPPVALADGIYILTASQTDAAGNVSPVSATDTVTLTTATPPNNTPPPPPPVSAVDTVTLPTANPPTNNPPSNNPLSNNPPTNNTPETLPPPTVAFDPTISVLGRTVTLTGTVAAGVSGVEISEGTTNLGAATLNGDGTWSFAFAYEPGFHTGLHAVATDGQGLQTTAPSFFDLTTGIVGEPYRTNLDSYDPASDAYQGSTFFGRDGAVYLQNSYRALPNGGETYTYTAGSFFRHKAYSTFADSYDADGDLTTHVETNRGRLACHRDRCRRATRGRPRHRHLRR